MTAARKQASSDQQMDFSIYDEKDLRKIKRIIIDELKERKRHSGPPSIGTKVLVLHGSRRGRHGIVALHMANRTCLIVFEGNSMSRIPLSRLEVVETNTLTAKDG